MKVTDIYLDKDWTRLTKQTALLLILCSIKKPLKNQRLEIGVFLRLSDPELFRFVANLNYPEHCGVARFVLTIFPLAYFLLLYSQPFGKLMLVKPRFSSQGFDCFGGCHFVRF